MKEFRIDANIHIVDWIEAETEEEAIAEFLDALEFSGELWGKEIIADGD